MARDDPADPMLTPTLQPRTALGAGATPRAPRGRVPWLVAFVVSLAVTALVSLPLALWAHGAGSAPTVPTPLVERT